MARHQPAELTDSIREFVIDLCRTVFRCKPKVPQHAVIHKRCDMAHKLRSKILDRSHSSYDGCCNLPELGLIRGWTIDCDLMRGVQQSEEGKKKKSKCQSNEEVESR